MAPDVSRSPVRAMHNRSDFSASQNAVISSVTFRPQQKMRYLFNLRLAWAVLIPSGAPSRVVFGKNSLKDLRLGRGLG